MYITILGPIIENSSEYYSCQMRYHIEIEGNFTGQFIIGIRNIKTNHNLTIKSYDDGLNNYFWQIELIKFDLTAANKWSDPFQVYFYTDIKSQDQKSSYIAIDDISFMHCNQTNNSTWTQPTTASSPSTQITSTQSSSSIKIASSTQNSSSTKIASSTQNSSSTQSLPSTQVTSSQKPNQSTVSSSTSPITSSTIKGITGTQVPVTTGKPVGQPQSNSKGNIIPY